jgi:signal transduction histidine kinase
LNEAGRPQAFGACLVRGVAPAAKPTPIEHWNFEDLLFTTVVLAAGVGWFLLRRYNELRAELTRREAAEALAAVLLARSRELAQQLIRAQEAERLLQARELHDELPQRCNMGVAAQRGLGLLGAAERAAAAGGELQVHSAPGSGVRLLLRLPLKGAPGSWREAAQSACCSPRIGRIRESRTNPVPARKKHPALPLSA